MSVSLSDIFAYFIVLITAFFAGEYLTISLSLKVDKKQRAMRLAIAFVSACLTYLFAGVWSMWFVIPAVFVVHAVFALIPATSIRTRFMRESIRIILLVLLAVFCSQIDKIAVSNDFLGLLVFVGGGVGAIFYAGEFVGIVTAELAAKNDLSWRGLESGGLWIGRLERLLIFIFIVMNQPAGVGFLIAAKSILRFSESRTDQRIAEYVLIGTLLSFALALAISWGTQRGIIYFSTFD